MKQLRVSGRYGLPALAAAAVLGVGALVSGGGQAAAVQQVDFARDVWPIVQTRCVSCHGPVDQFNDLRMDSKDALLAGGRGGLIIVPGKPEESTFYTRVNLPADDLDLMPAEGDPLSPAEVKAIRDWIAQGADFGGWTGS